MLKPIDKEILHIAVPSIVTNITVPLLGLVDVAITGHIGDATYIGAIAVGSMLFNVIYWLFGFLRMGTSGMTSQAFGRSSQAESAALLVRSLAVALGIAALLLVFQRPLFALAASAIGVGDDLRPLVDAYFSICVWGAPAMLCLYGLTGWFIGMQNTRVPLVVSVMQNVVNIVASLALVFGLGMKIEGVATGTVVAQYAGLAVALTVLGVVYRPVLAQIRMKEVMKGEELIKFFKVNRDIFIRTLFLVAVNLYFVAAGTKQGTVVLAVNTLMMQLYTLVSYVMDGFAYAGEALCGKRMGEGNRTMYSLTVKRIFAWGTALMALFTIAYALGGNAFLGLLTTDAATLAAAPTYFAWAIAIPFAGMAAFVWDGVFIGSTATRGMLVSSGIASVLFFAVYLSTENILHNHALWLAFILYLLARGVAQTIIYNTMGKRWWR